MQGVHTFCILSDWLTGYLLGKGKEAEKGGWEILVVEEDKKGAEGGWMTRVKYEVSLMFDPHNHPG